MTTAATQGPEVAGWLDNGGHRRWLQAEGDRLLEFYERGAADPEGGFFWLDAKGQPDRRQPKYLWINARMIHVFALAHLGGRPGATTMVDHGLSYLRQGFVDEVHGGWYWSVDGAGPTDASKQAYGHAFVLLAASSAAQAGAAGAAELLEQATVIIDSHFWDDTEGLCVDSWDRKWQQLEAYRGQNANMHMTEAFLAASEATGDEMYARRAARTAERLIREITAANHWRIPEHFDADWHPDLEYNQDDPENLFRPFGSTIGHWLEWARLLVLLNRSPVGEGWMLDAAEILFEKGTTEGWDDERGGLRFTVDWDGRPLNEDRYHWPLAEAIGAASALARVTRKPFYEGWYQRLWDYAARYLIDRTDGSWHHQLDATNRPSATAWEGKPDLYHAFQATLSAATPPGSGFAAAQRADPEAGAAIHPPVGGRGARP